ncbi:MAG: PrsW family glutamic-type intramembrane protease [Actinomycetia bacterium]|nr:PrsW family glutamic-type intramembrane protease [Actinomycetes bacterium]
MIERSDAVSALGDPGTSPQTLADITQTHPDLWEGVAWHPNAYPALLDWLASQGVPRVSAAVAAVRTRSALSAPQSGAAGGALGAAQPPYATVPPAWVYPGPEGAGRQRVQQALDKVTGFEGEAIVRFRDLFGDTFKRHTRADMDALMYSGTEAARYDHRWRLPWLYARVFAVLLGTYLLLWLCMNLFADTSSNVIPGVIFTGALVMPATVMVFFWEFNQARNVSLFDVIRIFFIGGALSILLTFVVSSVTDVLQAGLQAGVGANLGSAVFIGFTEELAKAIVVFLLVRPLADCLISNGLLVGAIVGTGFAVFETMGYGTRGWIADDLSMTLLSRGILSVGGHIVWAAIAGAAIMLAQRPGATRVDLKTTDWRRFLPLFAVPFALHTLWDFISFTVASDVLAYVLLGGLIVIAWVFIVRLINSGLRQHAALLGQPV